MFFFNFNIKHTCYMHFIFKVIYILSTYLSVICILYSQIYIYVFKLTCYMFIKSIGHFRQSHIQLFNTASRKSSVDRIIICFHVTVCLFRIFFFIVKAHPAVFDQLYSPTKSEWCMKKRISYIQLFHLIKSANKN